MAMEKEKITTISIDTQPLFTTLKKKSTQKHDQLEQADESNYR